MKRCDVMNKRIRKKIYKRKLNAIIEAVKHTSEEIWFEYQDTLDPSLFNDYLTGLLNNVFDDVMKFDSRIVNEKKGLMLYIRVYRRCPFGD